MIRPKGGRSQPRYHYLKQAGANKIVKYMEGKEMSKKKRLGKIEEVIMILQRYEQVMGTLIASAKAKVEALRNYKLS